MSAGELILALSYLFLLYGILGELGEIKDRLPPPPEEEEDES